MNASTTAPAPPLLRLEQVTIRFGGLVALDSLDLDVHEGEIVGLIGPNGAGKTTVFNLVTGVYVPTHGRILLAGERIDGRKPHEIARRGITRTFQNARLFRSRSCVENVAVGAHCRAESAFLDAMLRTKRFAREERELLDGARDLLEKLGLAKQCDVAAGELPYGLQRRLEIARALASGPRLLLLDEPAAGLNPQETTELMAVIESLGREFRVTIFLIEHDMRVVMGICRRIAVLDYGVKIAEGAPAEIRSNPKVIEAYLGEELPAGDQADASSGPEERA